MTNWGAQTQLEKDIAQEDFNPLNSRLLAIQFMSVDDKFIQNPKYLLQKEIVRILWPELLTMPINPILRNYAIRVLKKIGLIKYLK